MAKRINFTQASLTALPIPSSGREYVYDLKTPGLQLCMSAAGGKVFYVYRRVAGKPSRIRLGDLGSLNVAQARKAAALIAGEVAEGRNPAQARRAARLEPTLGDLWEHFRTTHAEPKLSPRTVSGYRQQWEGHLKPWAGRKLSVITRGDVAKLHAKIGKGSKNGKRKTGGPYMANRMLALLGSMYAKAGELGWKGDHPAKGIKRFPERDRERFLTGDELPRFFKGLAQEPSDTMRAFFALALLTGARRSNVQAMRWDEIDFDARMWTIPHTKSGKPVIVPLSPLALDLLAGRRKAVAGEWVFPGRGKSGHLEEPKKAWTELLKRAKLDDLRLHDLRRTLGSWQAIMGSSLPIIGKALGHRNQASTAIYARLSVDPVRESVNRATTAMLTAAGLLKLEADKTGESGENEQPETQ